MVRVPVCTHIRNCENKTELRQHIVHRALTSFLTWVFFNLAQFLVSGIVRG